MSQALEDAEDEWALRAATDRDSYGGTRLCACTGTIHACAGVLGPNTLQLGPCTQADTYVAAFRSWLDRFAGGGPWGRAGDAYLARLGPRLPRDMLLDRYVAAEARTPRRACARPGQRACRRQ